jgi:hypothetical protein
MWPYAAVVTGTDTSIWHGSQWLRAKLYTFTQGSGTIGMHVRQCLLTGDNAVLTLVWHSLESCVKVLLAGSSTGPLLTLRYSWHSFQFKVSRICKNCCAVIAIVTVFLQFNSGA